MLLDAVGTVVPGLSFWHGGGAANKALRHTSANADPTCAAASVSTIDASRFVTPNKERLFLFSA